MLKTTIGILCCFFCLASLSLSFDFKAHPELRELKKNRRLPNPLRTFDGDIIDTPSKWNARKEELKSLFQHYMYGYFPQNLLVDFDVVKEIPILGGSALYKEILIKFKDLGPPANFIRLSIFLPKSEKKVPLILGINKCGNQSVFKKKYVSVDKNLYLHPRHCFITESLNFINEGIWPVRKILKRGYGLATFSESYMDADKNDFNQDGIHGKLYPLMRPRYSLSTLGAWALGLMKSVDYLVTDHQVDKKKIAVIGHSRRGKAALLAGAFDERISLVAPVQSGLGGTAPIRGAVFRESAKMIVKGGFIYEDILGEKGGLSHFFSPEFHLFINDVNRLPVDQNLLISLVAPRPMINTQGRYDFWAGPKASFKAMKSANRVYSLLGSRGFISSGKIKGDEPINKKTAGKLLHYTARTGHIFNDHYWMRILDFADIHFLN